MTTEWLVSLVTTRSLQLSVAIYVIYFAIAAIASLASRRADNDSYLMWFVGGAVIFGMPLAIAAFASVLVLPVLIAAGFPAIGFVFIALAALIFLRASLKLPGREMEGCTKIVGVIWSLYAIVWSLVSFHALGGMAAIDDGGLDWLKPPLAALPLAITTVLMTDAKRRSAWQFINFWVVVGAIMALAFYPVERGFLAAVLPRNDWLRFPLMGLLIVAVVTLLRLATYVKLKPNVRRIRMRDLRNSSRILATVFVLMGLAWALASALVAVLV